MEQQAGRVLFASVELVPPKSLAVALRSLVRMLPTDVPAEVVAGSREYPFHLTVLFTVMANNLEAEIERRVASVARTHRPLTLRFTGFRQFVDRSVVLLAQKSPEILALHRDTVDAARTLPHPPRQWLRTYFTRSELQRFLRVGDPYALDQFNPHITLARFAEKIKMKDLGRLERQEALQQFRFYLLRVRVWADEGSIARTILRWRLDRPGER